MPNYDHPIFLESIRLIKARLGCTGLDPLQQQVLERLIHSSGDFSIVPLLFFSPAACDQAIRALSKGAAVLTDTAMAAEAVKPMARRTFQNSVRTVNEWTLNYVPEDSTKTAEGMRLAWRELSNEFPGECLPIVIIGSSPTALNALLDLVVQGAASPSLIIGMPVGFVGVEESKKRLSNSNP